MTNNHSRPRWGILYLVLPLAGGLLWLIHRARPAGTARTLLDLGALLVVFVFVEIWERANDAALLRQPFAGDDFLPLYVPRETAAGQPTAEEPGIPAVLASDEYGDLFPLPVQVGEPEQTFEPERG